MNLFALLDLGEGDARRVLALFEDQANADLEPRKFMLQTLRARYLATEGEAARDALQRLHRRIENLSNLKAAQLQAFCQGYWAGRRDDIRGKHSSS